MADEKEVRAYDNTGIADAAEQGVGGPGGAREGIEAGSREAGKALGDGIAAFLSAHGHEIEEESLESLEDLIAVVRSTEWAGPLPPPEVLSRYPTEVQSHIINWSDAQITGAGRRADYTAETERIAVESDAGLRRRD